MNNSNIDFIKMQMEERDYLKRNIAENEMLEEKYLTDQAMNEYDQKEMLKREHMHRLQNQHLNQLQHQIEDRKKMYLNEDKMNINEANINNYIGVYFELNLD